MKNLFDHVTGGWTIGRESLFLGAMNYYNLPIEAFLIEECSDEWSGRRYGNANCRFGFATKLGGGGRNKGNKYAYQVWAVVKPEFRI